MLEICKYKVHYLNLTFCILPTCSHAYITVYRLANKKWPSQYVCYYLPVSLSLVNMYYSRLPVQAQPWQMLTGPRPPAALATGEGFAGWAERTGLCVWGVLPDANNYRSTVLVRHKHKPLFLMERTPYSCRSHGNSWNRYGLAADSLPECVLVYVCACVLKDPRCALWSVHPCNPQAGFLGITNQPIRALTLSSLFLSHNPHTQKPYRIECLF